MRARELVPELLAPHFLRRLDGVASRALLKRTVEGNVAVILIYHQLVEEMLRVLLQDCELYIRLAVFPAQISFPIRRKQVFGQLQQTLFDSLDFPKKSRILKRAGRLNTIRNTVVHRLIQKQSLSGLRQLSLRAQRIYEELYPLFEGSHDFFRLCFRDFRRDTFEES
jgi:hypothetical protein